MNLRVLVVDDNPDYRMLVRFSLEGSDVELVGEAPTMAAGVEAATTLQPDLIVLDVVLQGDDVLAALQQLRDAAPLAAVVVVASYAEHELWGLSPHAEGVAYLSKGTPPRSLRDELLRVAASARAVSDVLTSERERFPSELQSARDARRFAAKVLSSWGCEDIEDAVLLLVSELVTNAVIHAHSDVEVVLRLRPSTRARRDHRRRRRVRAAAGRGVRGPVRSRHGADRGTGGGVGRRHPRRREVGLVRGRPWRRRCGGVVTNVPTGGLTGVGAAGRPNPLSTTLVDRLAADRDRLETLLLRLPSIHAEVEAESVVAQLTEAAREVMAADFSIFVGVVGDPPLHVLVRGPGVSFEDVPAPSLAPLLAASFTGGPPLRVDDIDALGVERGRNPSVRVAARRTGDPQLPGGHGHGAVRRRCWARCSWAITRRGRSTTATSGCSMPWPRTWRSRWRRPSSWPSACRSPPCCRRRCSRRCSRRCRTSTAAPATGRRGRATSWAATSTTSSPPATTSGASSWGTSAASGPRRQR